MNLPDLKYYRSVFQGKGITLPLKEVPSSEGLRRVLPDVPEGKVGWPWTEETNPMVYVKRAHWPKLTIVTPSYNQGQFIEETIRSVLLQNYPNLEFIVIDGGSSDGTKTILEKYSPWISYWQSEKDEGQGQAINRGFSLASGTCFAWINSDDYYLKNVFLKVTEKFMTSNTQFIYGFGYSMTQESRRFELIKVLPFWDLFIKIPSLIQPSTFWLAAIHQPIWEELHCSLDFELWLRLVKGKKRYRIKEPLSVANAHMDAKTHDPKMKAQWDQDHRRIWSADAHGEVYEWKRIVFLNRVRKKIWQMFKLT
ncbi:glycosyltransferase family 2 protein [Mucilaginibacter flavus]|uniref:glycosyltransferase family 2 protein n=1 Tax=Mucilaginibacter flavus TaxID=931504 RepID=UPI0025B4CEEE|nr:glycosyltransferase family 2 protein [Mucilaginibacter flavus]MDN3584411.1 glycosyltransferase family 2 protein [Mucilaginibacter flavus]